MTVVFSTIEETRHRNQYAGSIVRPVRTQRAIRTPQTEPSRADAESELGLKSRSWMRWFFSQQESDI